MGFLKKFQDIEKVDDAWLKTRMEMNPKRQWYLAGTSYCDGDLENIRARVSRTLQEAR